MDWFMVELVPHYIILGLVPPIWGDILVYTPGGDPENTIAFLVGKRIVMTPLYPSVTV